jgi:DNA-binding winged helix-turn-helix (wHTH) protein/TolB-like protein
LGRATESARRVRFGECEIDLRTGELQTKDRKLILQEKPFQILSALLARPGELVTRGELKTKLWSSDTFVDFDHSLNKAVNRLCDALGDAAEHPRFIETLGSRGYRFVAPAQVVTDNHDSAGEQRNRADAVESETEHESPGISLSKGKWVASAITMFILVGGVYLWLGKRGRTVPANPRATIAVLPFQNAGSDRDLDFLRLALPDEIVNSLSYSRSLSIRPSAMTSRYLAPELDLQKIGGELHISNLVTGHYQRERDRLQVTLEAVEVKNSQIVWQEILGAGVQDMIEMRDQITTRIRLGLIPALGIPASADTGTRPQNEEAYDLYLHSVAVSHDPGPNREAIPMLERSVGIDPSFASAWAALGLRYTYDATYSKGGEEMFRRSNQAYERALALDPNLMLAAGQLITNRVERGEPGKAYDEAQTLVKRHPESAQAHFVLSYVFRYAGMLEESGKECDIALELDPGNYTFRSCAWAFMELGKTQRAGDFLRLDAGSDWAAYGRVTALLDEGKPAEAHELVRTISSNPNHFRDLLEACLQPGPASELDKLANESESSLGRSGDPEALYYQGAILAYCGRKENAVRLLSGAIQANYCAYAALQADPLLAKLRASPEFSQLLSAAKECQRRFLPQQGGNPTLQNP